ncbi:MAG TPA: hypothetical protein VMB74_03280 [Streptosporangiaceae bacterium]|nr:hypothetical protein [Streptosporangiaceae bacterium]
MTHIVLFCLRSCRLHCGSRIARTVDGALRAPDGPEMPGRPGSPPWPANEIGVFGWALAAGAGLTELSRANAVLFVSMHVVGGAVLVYLGVTA